VPLPLRVGLPNARRPFRLALAHRVRAPIFILHCERDRVVPVRFGRTLFDATPEPTEGWFAPEAGRENLARYGSLYAFVAFIERRLGGSRSRALFLPDKIGDTPGTRILGSNGALCVDPAVYSH